MNIVSAIKINDHLKFRVILLLACVFVIIFREINLLVYPRFWAEEGQLFYPFALKYSVVTIFATPLVGYLTLFNSIISAIQAKLFSIESAPLLSTYAGFIVQLVPVVIVIFTSHEFWNSAVKKIICSLIIVVLVPPEMFLNTTNSHFIFGLITFLVMVVPAFKLPSFKKYSFRILLIIGGLTGPASMFLSPIFIYKAYREKSKEKYVQAAILSLCAIIQASVIIYTLLYSNNYKRLQPFDLNLTAAAFFTDNFSLNMNRMSFGIAMFFLYVYLFIKNRKSFEHRIFLLSFIVISVFSTLGSLNMQGAPRYSYIPTVIFMMMLAFEFFELKITQLNSSYLLASVFFVPCFLMSFMCYTYRMQYVYQPGLPVWKDEVAKYRLDSNYKPIIHPDYLFVEVSNAKNND